MRQCRFGGQLAGFAGCALALSSGLTLAQTTPRTTGLEEIVVTAQRHCLQYSVPYGPRSLFVRGQVTFTGAREL
jgi:hypothetical protein